MTMKFGDRSKRQSQSGITLLGLIFWAVLLSAVVLVAMKVFPAINEYRTIQSMVNKIAQTGAASVPEIRAAFEKARTVEYGVTSVTGRDLDISKEDDRIVIKFAYDKEIPLIEPVYLLIKFEGQSR
ncbi:DUF4845 domain-containing protein [Aquabacterium sp.]|uniref:DUF4845 domain-containing protein n=1 Tax=Aquabacterium sp. TaxID=1872578 RepID=UPI002E317719|nr:DUF4845 domain-containing protein [Aquabacterium sp.]HEX5312643.1 DUF4845 domain-containing protein [Aquabacterium sp.]